MNWTTVLLGIIIIAGGIGYFLFTKKTHDKSKELTKEVLKDSAVIYTRANYVTINGVQPEKIGQIFFTRMLGLTQLYQFSGNANITVDFEWTQRQGNSKVIYTIKDASLTTRLEKGKEYVLFVGNKKNIPEGANAAIGELKDTLFGIGAFKSNTAIICLEKAEFERLHFWQFQR